MEYGVRSAAPLQPVLTDASEIIRKMDEASIDQAVLSVTIPGVDWLEPNEAVAVAEESNAETAALATRYPGRLFGLATVPLQVPERCPAVLEKAAVLGLRGAMVYSNVAGGHLDDPSCRPFFAAAAEAAMPILLHPTYPLCAPTVSAHGMIEIVGFLFDTTRAALRLVFDGLFDRHPDLVFIVPHAGSLIPYFVGRIDHFGAARPGSTGQISASAGEHVRKFYIDTVSDWPPALKLCLDFYGPDRIMFGTDYPFWAMSTARQAVDQMGATQEIKAAILHGNARRVFRLEAPPRPS